MRDRTIRRILILTKFRFIGDTLLAIPLFRAVRAHWPQAHIALVTGIPAHIMLQNNPYLDEIIEYDPHVRDRGLRVYSKLLRHLRRERFDVSLTLNRSFHSALTPWLAGASIRAGSHSEGRSFLFTHPLGYRQDRSEIECYFDVLRAVTPDVVTDPALELWLTDAEREQAAQRLRESFGPSVGPARLIGIQPGASNALKQWDAARFAEVADVLSADPDVRLVLLGGAGERAAAEAMQARMAAAHAPRVADFVGGLDLRSSLAMVSQLDLFVGNDTALRHAAVALGVSSLCLFGPTNVRKWGDYGGCHRNIVAPDGTMAGITAAEVIRATRELASSRECRR